MGDSEEDDAGDRSDADHGDSDPEVGDVADSNDERRVWLVDRQSRDENLVTLVYATTDGEYHLRKQLSFQLLSRNPTTAAVDADPESLEPVADPDDRERYAQQAQSMAAEHDPDDEV